MASATNRISAGFSSRFNVESSFINSSSMCSRPAVSTRITSHAESFASRNAPRTISSGLSVPAPGQMGVPVAFATCANCSRAAGRYTSVETTMGRCPCSREPFAELAGGRGFTGALQSADEPHGRRTRTELRLRLAPEQFSQLVADDLHNLLIGRKLQEHFRAERLLADVRDEFVRDAAS